MKKHLHNIEKNNYIVFFLIKVLIIIYMYIHISKHVYFVYIHATIAQIIFTSEHIEELE